jgi:hypothetical protein
MKFLLMMLFLTTTVSAGTSRGEYPTGPDATLTPGRLCDRPDAYRYPERIPYCNRHVDPALKDDVFREYRNEGYRLNPKDRNRYKIDHLSPLCAGGSNEEDNLWPQHETIYIQTDAIEAVGCEKLKLAKIKQSDLVKLIIASKKNLTLAPKTLSYLNSL